MKQRIRTIAASLLMCLFFSACGSNPELTRFRQEIDDFCTAISEIDTSINNVDAQSEYATTELLKYLDNLESTFHNFSELDFPEEFDYLEPLADEAAEYMATAVKSYHDTYSQEFYDENTAEYARENYARAYKRIQIIITFLHGEEPEDVSLSTSEEEPIESTEQQDD